MLACPASSCSSWTLDTVIFQTRQCLVPQVVPVEIDFRERLSIGAVTRADAHRRDAVRDEQQRLPRGSKGRHVRPGRCLAEQVGVEAEEYSSSQELFESTPQLEQDDAC